VLELIDTKNRLVVNREWEIQEVGWGEADDEY
jgi:hypothetical protein